MYRENLKKQNKTKKTLKLSCQKLLACFEAFWKNGHWVTLYQNFSNYLDLSKNMTTRVELGFSKLGVWMVVSGWGIRNIANR